MKRTKGLVVFCTGISGSDRAEYLREVIEYSKAQKKDKNIKIRIINIGELMYQIADELGIHVTEERILDLNPTTLEMLRSTVFENVINSVDRNNKNEITIINSHACFWWKNGPEPAFNFHYLNRLDPDLFVTMIDTFAGLKKRLNETKQWKGKLTEDEILIWQDVEIFTTKIIAQSLKKDFYIIARRQPPSTLYNLMVYPDIESVYISYPMTHLSGKEMKKIKSLLQKLREYFVVFDPAAMEDVLTQPRNLRRYTKTLIGNQTVKRDHRLIDQSDRTIAYFPKIVYSSGVDTINTRI